VPPQQQLHPLPTGPFDDGADLVDRGRTQHCGGRPRSASGRLLETEAINRIDDDAERSETGGDRRQVHAAERTQAPEVQG
jgi:hypothetical protein